jgi:hypothetical protein
MLTILIVDDHLRAGQLYTASLEAYVGASVVVIDDVDKAAEYIITETPSLVITRSPIQERDIGLKCSGIISKKKLPTKLIIIGRTKVSSHEASLFDDLVTVSDIIRSSAQLLGVTAKDMAHKDVGDYYPIRTNLLCPNLVLICPVFRKKKDGDEYLPFLEKDSKIHAEIISILKFEKEEFIYVESINRLKFVNSLTIFLSEMLSDDSLDLEDTVLFANHGYMLVRDAARKMMITPEVIQLTENNISTMTSIINKIPRLKELLDATTKNVNRLFRHSLLVSYVATFVINRMEWGNQEQKVKIVFVSFFHDIALMNDDFTLIHSDEELELANLCEEEKTNVKRHAINAATIVNTYHSRLPFGVDTIIKQHHGSRDGIGFSTYPSSISPLALIFMVCEDWVHLYLKSEKLNIKIERQEILNRLKIKYKGAPYNPIHEILEDLTI